MLINFVRGFHELQRNLDLAAGNWNSDAMLNVAESRMTAVCPQSRPACVRYSLFNTTVHTSTTGHLTCSFVFVFLHDTTKILCFYPLFLDNSATTCLSAATVPTPPSPYSNHNCSSWTSWNNTANMTLYYSLVRQYHINGITNGSTDHCCSRHIHWAS